MSSKRARWMLDLVRIIIEMVHFQCHRQDHQVKRFRTICHRQILRDVEWRAVASQNVLRRVHEKSDVCRQAVPFPKRRFLHAGELIGSH